MKTVELDPHNGFKPVGSPTAGVGPDPATRGFVSKNDECCIKIEKLCIKNEELSIKNEELCIKNEEICIKNEELSIKNDEFCRRSRVITTTSHRTSPISRDRGSPGETRRTTGSTAACNRNECQRLFEFSIEKSEIMGIAPEK